MNILIVSERWWPEGTGGILASYLIASILRDAGFKLTVVHGTKEPEIVKGVNYIYTEPLSVRNKHRLWVNCFALARQSWFLNALRSCDVVYIPRYCYPLVPFAKKLGKRAVVHLHDYQPVSYNAVVFNGGERNGFGLSNVVRFEVLEHGSVSRAILGTFTAPVSGLCRLWLGEADAIICVSRRQAEIISSKVPELAHKIRVVYNPLPETPPIEKKFECPTFAYSSGGSYVKGFQVFVRGAMEVLKRGNNTNFLLMGRLKASQEGLLERLNNVFKGKFSFLGFLSHGEALRLYSKNYALLFPSICEEPLPYTVIEAMLAGTIPIASRIGGIPEIVKGTYAEKMMFTPGDPGEMADRMEEVLSLPEDRLVDIGCQLRETVLKRFGHEAVKRKLLKAVKV